MTRKIKNLIKDFSISSFNYSGGMGGGEAGIDPPTTTKGDLSGFDTTFDRVPIGADTQVLTADSTEALGLKWAAPEGGGKMELLYSDKLTADGNSSLFTPSTNIDMLTNYSALICYANGSNRVANDMGIKINGSTDYDYNYILTDSGVLSSAHVNAATMFEAIPSELMVNDDYTSYFCRINWGANSENNGRPMIQGIGMSVNQGLQLTYGVMPANTTDIDTIEFVSSNATGFRDNYEFLVYGVAR